MMVETRSQNPRAAPTPTVAVSVARDITMPFFHGHSDEDGRRWLSMFLRFAKCHGWDESFHLAFVAYYLRDGALRWFDNQDFSSWATFESEFKVAYADDHALVHQATEELRSRAQRPGESCHDYVQAILHLCRSSQHVFYLLYPQNFSSVTDLLSYCRKLDQQL